MALRVGIDTGGTFTDICVFDEATGTVSVRKVSSTPDDPGRAILDGATEFLSDLDAGGLAAISTFAHGTTVGTNALLTHRGVRTGLITTRGFRDLLELGRGHRPSMYDLQADKPTPFVPRDLRLEVTERVRWDGTVETDLDMADVERAIDVLEREGIASISVCLLYSFLRPDHERRIGEAVLARLPDAYVSLSSDVLPEFREYERLSTVVTNSYIGPVVADYLSRLRSTLAAGGLECVPHVTQSNGGIIPFARAERLPVKLVLSGPSTGVVGAAAIAKAAGFGDIITFDVGGTSSDVSLVQAGEPKFTTGMQVDGQPVRSPMLDIHTVGAGGGSIAWIDSGGHLRVGPQSAGAFPGPACYGNGTEPTVTDANVVLGTLNPDHFLGGRLVIDPARSVSALDRLGARIGMTAEEAAEGMLRVVTANMARAIRVISVQRGYDPRDYVLFPFGGAGPLHASRLARELGCARVLVPTTPGALSALGLLMTDIRADFVLTRRLALDEDAVGTVGVSFAALEDQAEAWFEEQGIEPARRGLQRAVDVRYAGQNYELTVPVPGPVDSPAGVAAVVAAFEAEHERLYGYAAVGERVEVVTFRVAAGAEVPHVELETAPPGSGSAADALVAHRPVLLDAARGFESCPVYARDLLQPGHELHGPAVVEQMDTTTVILPGDHCEVDEHRNLVIEIGA